MGEEPGKWAAIPHTFLRSTKKIQHYIQDHFESEAASEQQGKTSLDIYLDLSLRRSTQKLWQIPSEQAQNARASIRPSRSPKGLHGLTVVPDPHPPKQQIRDVVEVQAQKEHR